VTDLLRLVRVHNLLWPRPAFSPAADRLRALQTPNVLALARWPRFGFGMAGNVLNDIWDQAADRVNRPGGQRPLAAAA